MWLAEGWRQHSQISEAASERDTGALQRQIQELRQGPKALDQSSKGESLGVKFPESLCGEPRFFVRVLHPLSRDLVPPLYPVTALFAQARTEALRGDE